jgi:outer membrane protein assembly factor BamB
MHLSVEMSATANNRITRALTAIVCLALTTIPGHSAMAPTLERLGEPCRAKMVLAGRVVTDRTSGREMFVLADTNEATGVELIFVDFERDTATSYRAPAGAGAWALLEVHGDRLIVGTFYDGKFMVFDLKAMKFTATASFPGESYVWNLAIGGDGRVYGGTYPGAKLGALDLSTYAVENCGAPTTPPNTYLRLVSATPDGRILCSFGNGAPTTLLFDPATRGFGKVPPQIEGVPFGASWNGYFVAGSRAFKGRSLEVVQPPPFPVPPPDRGSWSVDEYMTTDEVLFLRQGNAVYRFPKGAENLTLVADLDLRGGRLLAGAAGGAVLGVRGQNYFVIKPGDRTLNLKPIPVESGPRPPMFLKADNRGRLWGGPDFGQTLFWLDLRTRKAVNTDAVCDASGEVYDVAFLNGRVYAVSYAGGDITEYDPAQPWDQWSHINPKPLAKVGPAYIRPTGGIVVGPGGRLYSGWMARYGVYGGAVAITDPATGATKVIENPLGEQAVEGLAVDERFAYIGTSLDANGLPPKRGEFPRFGVLDLSSHKIVFQHTFRGAGAVRNMAYDPKTKRVAFTARRKLVVFDTAKQRFAHGWRTDAPPMDTNPSAPGDGKVYYGRGNALLAVDLLTGQVTRIAEGPSRVNNVTVARDGTVYLSCGTHVYRVKMER